MQPPTTCWPDTQQVRPSDLWEHLQLRIKTARHTVFSRTQVLQYMQFTLARYKQTPSEYVHQPPSISERVRRTYGKYSFLRAASSISIHQTDKYGCQWLSHLKYSSKRKHFRGGVKRWKHPENYQSYTRARGKVIYILESRGLQEKNK